MYFQQALDFIYFSVNFKKYEKKAADISASKTLEVICNGKTI